MPAGLAGAPAASRGRVTRPSTAMAPGRHAPLGRCMYCLASGVKLTEEHLIPKALGGRRTLRDAVCEPCRARTGRLEQATLDRDFVVPKTLLALKRRRARKSGPRRLPSPPSAGVDDAPLDAGRYPRTFTLPMFPPPGLLAGEDRTAAPVRIDDVTCRLDLGTPRDEAAPARRALADPRAYGYAIAKWAYGLAVAERGLACCDTRAIRALLAGERRDVFNFVGGREPAGVADRTRLHGVALREHDGWLVATLDVLGSAGMPPYEVVIGTLAPSASDGAAPSAEAASQRASSAGESASA